MNSDLVVFIAFTEHENLGIGYLSSVLMQARYKVKIIDFRKDKSEILEELLQHNPLLVGFSVIYEYYLYVFKDLIEYLRYNGIQSHFTTGGHFASLRPVDLFNLIPSLDSIVRFEGEYTLLELVTLVHSGSEWREIKGISFRKNGKVENNRLRPLVSDIDRFPIPHRPNINKYILEKNFATLIAGRGCVYNCSFCDIREFYQQSGGPVKRIRNPVKVVEEMDYLYHEHDCSVFLFQDDDFPVQTPKKTEWIQKFCSALKDLNLSGKVMWKVNCRPDEIDPDAFKLMRQHGLFRVYIGIEEGTDSGLVQMNKRLSVSDTIRGIRIIKKLGIGIDYGFMLFQPHTTFRSLDENLNFLERICGDGYMPVAFLKMKPYLATEIEKNLREVGRLKGEPGFFDYEFYERSMNDYHDYVSDVFYNWINSPMGFSINAKWASNYFAVYLFYCETHEGIQHLYNNLIARVSEANKYIITTLKRLLIKFESGNYSLNNDQELDKYRISIDKEHQIAVEGISRITEKVELYSLTKDIFRF